MYRTRSHAGKARAGWLVWVLPLAACTGSPPGGGDVAPIEVRDGELHTCYRGELRGASMSGTTLVIEGDIAVSPKDQWCDDQSSGDPELTVKQRALRIQGAQFNWPNGVVPYDFGPDTDAPDADADGTLEPSEMATNFTAAEQSTIIAAMTAWSSVVPGLVFRPATASDVDRIRFEPDLYGCNSPVGRSTGTQRINFTDSCVTTFSVHHEIAHALGLFHTHMRPDRGSYVTINWANIKGCRSFATSSAFCGASACAGNLADCGCTAADVTKSICYMGFAFATATNSALVLAYDYDSVMHYTPTAFMKGGLPFGSQTITALNPAPTMGQRNHLSTLDIGAMRAAYPKFTNAQSLVVTSGATAVVCELLGREQDAATTYRRNGTGSYLFTGNRRTFSTFSGVLVENQSCDARSNFWLGTYTYPNPDTSRFGAESAPGDETFAVPSSSVAFIDASLIPAFIM
jgi:hypothetical protein